MIDINKTYRYRNGEPARIICVDRPHATHKVISMSKAGILEFHLEDGTTGDDEFNDLDLIECKEKKVVWVNIDNSGYCDFWSTKDAAYKSKNENIAIIKVEYDDGQFDE